MKTKKRYTILFFFGTRPEAIKMAPVVERLKKEKRFRVRVAVSAQHRQMLDQVLAAFRLRSDIDLDLMRPNQSLHGLTARLLTEFEPVLARASSRTLAFARPRRHHDHDGRRAGRSFYKQIPVGHVAEAGLRTQDKYRPFPEGDQPSTTHRRRRHALFRPDDRVAGEPAQRTYSGRVHFHYRQHGDRCAARHGPASARRRPSAREANLERAGEKRPRHSHDRSSSRKFRRAVRRRLVGRGRTRPPGVSPTSNGFIRCIPNPNVKGPAERRLGKFENIHLMEPLGYTDLVHVMNRSTLVVTDSGGLQEEAPSLGKPVIVLRRRHRTSRRPCGRGRSWSWWGPIGAGSCVECIAPA